MKELKINKGIELMLRRAKQKEILPRKGFTITKAFSLLKREVYFNFEFKWDKKET
jgi:hypothetical protein